jgi:S-adenosylmethionine:diacylglycerol 3-amino-3-carboxypropyl transferase
MTGIRNTMLLHIVLLYISPSQYQLGIYLTYNEGRLETIIQMNHCLHSTKGCTQAKLYGHGDLHPQREYTAYHTWSDMLCRTRLHHQMIRKRLSSPKKTFSIWNSSSKSIYNKSSHFAFAS